MKTFFRFLTVTVFCALFAIAASAKTVQVTDFGAVPDDGEDDTAAVRQAIEDISNFGGTVVFPAGVTEINENIEVSPQRVVSFHFVGDKGSYIKLNGDDGTTFFMFSNASQVEFDGLSFIADPSVSRNASRVIWFREAMQAKISRCQFIGVGAADALVEFTQTRATVEDTVFAGSGSQNAAIVGNSVKSLTVQNTTFNNTGEVMEMSSDKVLNLNQINWVRVGYNNGVGRGAIRIKDSFFDSAALKSLYFENQSSVIIDGINVNVSQKKSSAGVSLKNVAYSETLNSTFSSSEDRLAFELRNGSYMEVNAVTLIDQIMFGYVSSDSHYNVRFCPGCRIPN